MGLVRTINNGFTEYNAVIGFVHLSDIPTLRTDFPRGSYVIGIEDESRWILDDDLVWCKIGSGKTSGIHYVVVDELPDPSAARSDTMYLYKEDGDTYYSIYFLSNGSLEKIGGTESDFGDIATKEDLEDYVAKSELTDGSISEIDLGDEEEAHTTLEAGIIFIVGNNDEYWTQIEDGTIRTVIIRPSQSDITFERGTYYFDNADLIAKNNKWYIENSGDASFTGDVEVGSLTINGTGLDDYFDGIYLPIAGGTMEGNIIMQDNIIQNTNYEFNTTEGLKSRVSGTVTYYGAQGFQIQTNATTSTGLGSIYINPASLTYNFVADDDNTMQWTSSAGAFQIQGSNNFNFHLLNNEMLYTDSTEATEYRFGVNTTYLRTGYDSSTGIASRGLEITAGGLWLYGDQDVQIFNGTKAGAKRGIVLNSQYTMLQNGNKTIAMDSNGSLLSPNSTFTNNSEFVTKKYVDDAIAAAIANLG